MTLYLYRNHDRINNIESYIIKIDVKITAEFRPSNIFFVQFGVATRITDIHTASRDLKLCL